MAPCKAEPGKCHRQACNEGASIWLCNLCEDNEILSEYCYTIANDANKIAGTCIAGQDAPYWFSGASTTGLYKVIVMGDDTCADKDLIRPLQSA